MKLANAKHITALLLCTLSSPVSAMPKGLLLDWCDERPLVDSCTKGLPECDPTEYKKFREITDAHYRTGWVIGYLGAVLDTLRDDGECFRVVDEKRFCSAFMIYFLNHPDWLDSSTFEHARNAVKELIPCEVKSGD